MDTYKPQLISLLAEKTPLESDELEKLITIPNEKDKGNFSLPCFILAKKLKKNPKVIAEEIASTLELGDDFEKVEALNGYLNFYLDQSGFVKKTLEKIDSEGENFGSFSSNGKTICIDFSSPNIGKELAFHHLRSTMIGNSLSRIYKSMGYKVERINHLGDWGTQFGKLITMYLEQGLGTDDETLENVTIQELNKLYTAFSTAAKEKPEMEEQARAAFTKLEQGDEFYIKLWLAFKAATMKELDSLYTLMGVEFDHYTGEAFFNSHLENTLGLLKDKGILSTSQDRQVVEFEEEDMPPCLIQKSDGSTLYATRDLAAAIYRKKEYDFEKCLYVVDLGQGLHFKQVFKVLDKLGYEWNKDMVHIPFGLLLHYNEENKKWEKGKTRTGTSSLLRDVFDAAAQKILKVIEEKNADLENKEEMATQIGISALVFDTLKNRRLNDIKFDWDQALSFEGDTGPYVLNAYVRLCSILRKADREVAFQSLNFDNLKENYVYELTEVLSKLAAKTAQAAKVDEPYVLAQYALEIAEKAHRFIHHCRVLGSAEEKERLFLVQQTRLVLKKVLELLGLNPIEHM